MPASVSAAMIARAIRDTGLSGSAIALHSSLKSFGHLEGGVDTLLDAFTQAGCTLLVPTFTYACEAPPQRDIPRNGLDETYQVDELHALEFDPGSSLVSPEMGSLPARILQVDGRLRGRHALNSLTALGPLAEPIIAGQAPLSVYAPYAWLYDHPPAHVLLLGVDLTKATPVHFAEQRAGRALFHRWGREAGRITESQTGSCSEGFNRLLPCVEPIERRVYVGPSLWRIYPFREFIDRVSTAIRACPELTRCDDPGCGRCRDALLGGPLL